MNCANPEEQVDRHTNADVNDIARRVEGMDGEGKDEQFTNKYEKVFEN